MPNAYFTINRPENDPFLGYLPGSPERAALKEELAKQASQVVRIPLIIGGREVWTDNTISVTMPHDHQHVIAECCMAGEKELKMAIDAALAAKDAWESMPWEHRSAIFLKAADMITGSYRKVLNASTMLGQSKTVFQAEIDIAELADFLASASGGRRRSSRSSPPASTGSGTARTTVRWTASSAPFPPSTLPPSAATCPPPLPSWATWHCGSPPAPRRCPITIT